MIDVMVNARQAAESLALPLYWFTDNTMRAKLHIPHYLLVGMVRFRLSELANWAVNIANNQRIEGVEAQTHEEDQ